MPRRSREAQTTAGSGDYYQVLRAPRIGHRAALRQFANRLVGILHGCLKTHTIHDEHTTWAHHRTTTHRSGLTSKNLGCLRRSTGVEARTPS